MVAKLVDGDYVIENENIAQVDYIDEVLQNAFVGINAKRERFYPNKNFGSYIYLIENKSRPSYALSYARQAVDLIDGVYIKSVCAFDNGYLFKIMINDEEREIFING